MNEENLQAHIRLARTCLILSAVFALVCLVLSALAAQVFLGAALLGLPGSGVVYGFSTLLAGSTGLSAAWAAGNAYHNWQTAKELLLELRRRNGGLR